MPSSSPESTAAMSDGKPSMTFVTGLDAGEIRPGIILMARSLRRWGGRFSDARLLAVIGRSGAPLTAKFRRQADELSIEIIDASRGRPYPWQQFINKTLGVKIASEHATTEQVGWIDHDLIFLREPTGFELTPDADLTASLNDTHFVHGPDDAVNLPFWNTLREIIGLGPQPFPSGVPVAPTYYNAGIFMYRRATDFAALYHADLLKAMAAKVWHRSFGVHFIDQILLPMSAERHGLRQKVMDDAYNFPVTAGMIDGGVDLSKLADIAVLHFHDALRHGHGAKFLAALPEHRAVLSPWIAEHDADVAAEPRTHRWAREIRRAYRVSRRNAFGKTCRQF